MIRNRFFRHQGGCHKTIVALCALLAGFLAAGTHGAKEPLFPLQPIAEFTEVRSTTTEQHGRIELKVAFSSKFVGRLAYSVHGTADQGTDFKLSEGTVTTGRRVVKDIDIVIDLLDDTLVEGIETIVVRLDPGEGYRLVEEDREHIVEHVIELRDNDEAWRVVHDVEGMWFDYGMRIIRNGGSTVATVTNDGGNGLPAGIYPVDIGSADDNRFEAVVGPVTVAADRTLLGAEIGRTFKLVADPSRNDGHKVDHERLLIGAVTETWTSESAPHLARGNPISGTFLMSRIIDGAASGNTHAERSKGVNQDDSVDIGGLEAKSECVVVDMSGTSNYAVLPGESGSQTLWNPEMARVGQPFVAAHTPYPNFVTDTLNRARAELYYDKATTKEAKDLAAFRYKALLYEKEQVGAETYIRARFDQLADLWDCGARKRAHQTAQTVIDALRYAPWNRELRWALLDIYYDIAVADKALAQEKHVAVAEIMIKPASESPGDLIDEEIAILEDALPLYRHALAGYMKVIRGGFGVDVADFETEPALHGEPFGYLIFRKEVPKRSPLAALFRKNGAWMLPKDASTSDEQPELFQGYKDVTLLFELLREYLRTAEQLSKRYVIRSEPSDFERAEKLIGGTLLATWLEGNALLAMFPGILEKDEGKPVDPKSGLREAVAGYRHSYSALGHIRSTLKGDANILGFPDGFLVLTQSVIPGDPSKRYFHSYDTFTNYLRKNDIGPLKRAKDDLDRARQFYDNYEDRQDQLEQQFAERTEQYDERLRKIVGVMPGEPAYEGEINQQHTNIKTAARLIALNSKRIENLNEEIHTEIKTWEKKKKINNAMQRLYLKYGNKQANLSEEIGNINQRQNRLNNIVNTLVIGGVVVGAIVATGGTAGVAAGGAATGAAAAGGAATVKGVAAATVKGAAAVAAGLSTLLQWNAEKEKGKLQASKERLAATERAELASLEGALLELDFQKEIEKLWRQMSEIVFESEVAALRCQREMQRLAALYLEKESLERRKAEFNKRLADRYFADPSHRLLSNAAVLRSESSFANAQRWLFLAIRAGEYKWNRSFVHTSDSGVTITKQTLFRARNAGDLKKLFTALAEWDADNKLRPGRNDDGYYKLSLRDVLSYRGEFSDEEGQDFERFQDFIARPDNYLDPMDEENPMKGFKVFKFNFSTNHPTPGLLVYSRWNEKIKYLEVELVGAESKTMNFTIPGYLKYGGVSWIRNQKMDEITEYPTRSWSYDGNRWTSEEALGGSINIHLNDNPNLDKGINRIEIFKELSVAASDWTLYIPVKYGGRPLIDISKMVDVEFHINFYYYTR